MPSVRASQSLPAMAYSLSGSPSHRGLCDMHGHGYMMKQRTPMEHSSSGSPFGDNIANSQGQTKQQHAYGFLLALLMASDGCEGPLQGPCLTPAPAFAQQKGTATRKVPIHFAKALWSQELLHKGRQRPCHLNCSNGWPWSLHPKGCRLTDEFPPSLRRFEMRDISEPH